MEVLAEFAWITVTATATATVAKYAQETREKEL